MTKFLRYLAGCLFQVAFVDFGYLDIFSLSQTDSMRQELDGDCAIWCIIGAGMISLLPGGATGWTGIQVSKMPENLCSIVCLQSVFKAQKDAAMTDVLWWVLFELQIQAIL